MEGRLTAQSWCKRTFIGVEYRRMQYHAICLCVFVFSADAAGWEKGVLYAEGQNLARFLMEAPANHITPSVFAKTIEEKLAPHGERVTIKKRFVPHSSTPRTRTAVFLPQSCNKQTLIQRSKEN